MQGVAVHGIFLDETPNRYSAKTAEYLDAVRQEVKNSSGILGDRMVIYNPGSIPDTRFANLGPDLTAVFEETYQTYRSKALQDRLSSVPYARSRCCYIVHSVPSNEVRQLVTQLRHRAGYLFLTGLSENYYASFGPTWSDFVAAMSTE
ncbi:hypothetical protein FGG08_005698 [Glutinoglossum americanum]|uniref:Uncharacterized protein n=1 Tax=Glutinoglossum americanum TaxID=1670608 RepID=A0A9P8L1L5_9PEZI|nr:hypothetical protein FGG08_005698 [Glutinoglossum americanum]